MLAQIRHNEDNDASYSAKSVQIFGEASYRIDTPYVALEPFAGAAYVHVKTDGFSETGGITALTSGSDTTDLTTTTLGLRVSHNFTVSENTTLTAHGMAGGGISLGTPRQLQHSPLPVVRGSQSTVYLLRKTQRWLKQALMSN